MTGQVILSADDFGLTAGVNAAIRELAHRGTLSATNVMANMPHAHEIQSLAADHPSLSIGVHLNLTQGQPLCPPETVPSLVGPDGQFWPLAQLVRRAARGCVSRRECETELAAQVARARQWAEERLDHWNSHQGFHRYEPFASLAIRVCKGQIPAMRAHRHHFLATSAGTTPSRRSGARLIKESYYHWLGWRCRRHFRLPQGILAVSGGTALDVLRALPEAALPGGVWEAVCHPATTIDDLEGTSLTEARVREYHFLASAEFQQAVAAGRPALASFQTLVKRR